MFLSYDVINSFYLGFRPFLADELFNLIFLFTFFLSSSGLRLGVVESTCNEKFHEL